jgi:hypothetical protein
MARLVCMYGATFPAPATLDPRVAAALKRYAPAAGLDIEWVDTAPDLQVYADELGKRWGRGEDLIIVEQDKEVFPGQLESMLGCGEPWCGMTFWQNPVPHTALVLGGFGCTRFSPEVQDMIPVSAFRGETQVGIDRRFYDWLISHHGFGCHLHGHVLHHHVYPPRPLKVRRHVAALREQGILPPAVYPEPAGPHLLPGSWDLLPGSYDLSG